MFSKIIYGADYNPEQWSEDVWIDDMRLMKKAGVNMVNIGIFSWAIIQSDENSYNFEFLDKIMDLLYENEIMVNLATGTASQPAWLSQKYQDVLPVDEKGNKIWYGSRQTYCPNSKSYKRLSLKLVKELANHFKTHKSLVMWHVNNEYSDHTSVCYCETCEVKFREWLIDRYGSLDKINEAWGTNFWSQRYHNIDEIVSPKQTSADHNPCQLLDYKRFMSDSILELYKEEHKLLKEITPNLPVTTNFMGNNNKPLDYFKWAKEIDIISWDSYPDVSKVESRVLNAFTHDLMRGLKDSKPFIMMEQAPNQINWQDYNPNKRPGEMALYSYQALARGADGIMFFQWRQSVKGSEKFHSAMVTHTGDENSRTYKEVEKLGNELKLLGELENSRIISEVGIVFDYDNWWAVEYRPGPSSSLHYSEQVLKYYKEFYNMNISTDIIPFDGDFKKYKIIVAPLLYMVKKGFKEKIEEFVSSGGIFVNTFFSGIVKENDEVFSGGYPGPLKKVLGIDVLEYDSLSPQMSNKIQYHGYEFGCDLWCDVVKLNTAMSLSVFKEDYYSGSGAITVNQYGEGKAYYVATNIDDKACTFFIRNILIKSEVDPVLIGAEGVEITKRIGKEAEYIIALNHNNYEVEVQLPNIDIKDMLSGEKIVNKVKLDVRQVFIGKISVDL